MFTNLQVSVIVSTIFQIIEMYLWLLTFIEKYDISNNCQ